MSKSANIPQHWYANHGMKMEMYGKLKLAKICLKTAGHPTLHYNFNAVLGLKDDVDATVRKVGVKLA